MVAQVRDLEIQCLEQQEEIARLTEVCVQRFDDGSDGSYTIYTMLIDHETLRPISTERGTGHITLPTFPIHVDNDKNGALFDRLAFDITGVDNVTFTAPTEIHDPWIGMFDVKTNRLLVVYKFKSLALTRGSSLHVTFTSKMVAW